MLNIVSAQVIEEVKIAGHTMKTNQEKSKKKRVTREENLSTWKSFCVP